MSDHDNPQDEWERQIADRELVDDTPEPEWQPPEPPEYNPEPEDDDSW